MNWVKRNASNPNIFINLFNLKEGIIYYSEKDDKIPYKKALLFFDEKDQNKMYFIVNQERVYIEIEKLNKEKSDQK